MIIYQYNSNSAYKIFGIVIRLKLITLFILCSAEPCSTLQYPIFKKYGVKFAQSNETISFEGHITENEWSTRYTQTDKLCAKLLTIVIEEGGQKKNFKGFQDINYLLITEPQYENQRQGEPITICLDKCVNPGPLHLKKQISLTEPNYVHEFEKDDFIFLHDSNIKVDTIQKDYIEDVPSLLLRIVNPNGKINYKECEICFNTRNNVCVQSRGYDDGIWRPLENNIWKTFLSEFDVDGFHQHTISTFKYDSTLNKFILTIPENNRNGSRIEIYTKSHIQPPRLKLIVYKTSNVLGQCSPLINEFFYFPGNPLMIVSNILYHYKDNKFKPRPTILLNIERLKVTDFDAEYELHFTSAGNYSITNIINDWTECAEFDNNYLQAKIETFVINKTPSTCSGRIKNGKYQILVDPSNMSPGIPLMIYIKKNIMTDTRIHFYFKQTVLKNETKNITKECFSTEDTEYQVSSILYNYDPNYPSIFLAITHHPNQTIKKINELNPKLSGSAISNSDNRNVIYENTFDPIEYFELSDIYDSNLDMGFFSSQQIFTNDITGLYDMLKISQWRNTFIRKSSVENDDPLNCFVYTQVNSRHLVNNHNKCLFVLKTTDQMVSLTRANHIILDMNNKEVGNIHTWKIPTVQELTQIFQFKNYSETVSNHIQSFMFSYSDNENLSFLTSSFKDRQQKILWTVLFRCNQVLQRSQFLSMDYDLEYYPTHSQDKAYLLPVTVRY